MSYISGTAGNDDLYSGRNADYLDGGAGDDTLVGNGGDDTLEGGRGNDSLSGGDGADTFTYALGDGNDTITDYEDVDIIRFTSGNPKPTKKGDHIVFEVGTGSQKGTITVLNALKDGRTVTYIDANDEVKKYPVYVEFNDAKTKATIFETYPNDTFNIADWGNDYEGVKTIDGSAVTHSLNITANKEANVITGTNEDDYIEGGAGKDTINGGDGNDTIVGGTGNDNLTGGDGADVFVWNKGDGNDKILDYTNEDTIQVVGDTVKKISKSGDNIILKLASGKNISVVGGADKVISYTDNDYPDGTTYPIQWIVNPKGTAVTLLPEYSADTFDVTANEDFGTTARTIDGSAVDQDLSITGNKQANSILGGTGNNTLDGGKGNDTLTGGAGSNVFVYSNGGGNDVITDYKSGDVIHIASGKVSGAAVVGNDYVFTVGKYTLTVQNGAKKYIQVTDANDNVTWYPEPPLPQIEYDNGTVSLTKKYIGDTFDVGEFEDYFAGKVYKIDASAVTHSLHIIANKEANNITGTDEDDYIEGGAGKDTINGGDGNDTIVGGTGNDNLTGGDGADVFVWNKGDGNDKILDYTNEDSIQIVDDTIKTFKKSGKNIILKLASGKNISVVGGADKTISYTDNDNPNGATYPIPWIVNKEGTAVTLLPEYSADTFDVTANEDFGDTARTIDGSAVTHSLNITANKEANVIIGTNEDDYIEGGAGKDTINGDDGNDTIVGGTGNDNLTGGDGADVFVWNKGDGNDKILDYTNEDSIQIVDDTIKTFKKSGDNIILKLASGKNISVIGGADKTISYTDNDHPDGATYPIPWIVNKEGTAVTLLPEYSADTFDVTANEDFATTARTIDGSAVTHSLNITANKEANVITGTNEDDYIEGGAGKDTINGGDGNDTIVGGTGNDNLTGGDGADVFVWNKGDGNDKILDYTNEDTIQVVGDTIEDFKDSGDNIILKLASGKNISVVGGADKVISYTDNDHPNGATYPDIPTPVIFNKKSSATAATLTAGYTEDSFDIADYSEHKDYLVSIDASAVQHALSITANKNSNIIIGTDQNDTIYGGRGADTIRGGKGNDQLYGGDGADIFVWNKGDGNDKILDYTNEDSIEITGDTYKSFAIAKNGEDVVLTLASKKKITVTGGIDKVISGTDDNGGFVIGSPIVYNEEHTSATLTANYSKYSFDSTDYAEYVDSLATIDASAVTHDLSIIGNANKNKIYGTDNGDYIEGGKGADTLIGNDGNDTLVGGADNDSLYGGAGNDSLWGGAGTDTLFGGDGDDIFAYGKGDGKVTIGDYCEAGIDTIMVLEGAGNVFLKDVSNGNVIFGVGVGSGSGEIVVQDATNKYTEVVDTSGNRLAWRNASQ